MRFLALLLLVAAVCSGKSVEGPRRAVVNIVSKNDISGKIVLEQASPNSPVKVRGTVTGLEAGLHGMHIHEGKTLGSHCDAVGMHFNPTGKQHGGPRDPNRHVGDLGNIKTVGLGAVSRTDINVLSSIMSLYEDNAHNILGRALVIHANVDDLGRGNNPESLKNGNAGAHLACGLVELVEMSQEEHEHIHQSINSRSTILESSMTEENPWKEWAPSFTSSVPSNMNLARRPNRPDSRVHYDGFELKSAVSTNKVWKTGNVYEYDYNGFVTTGVMGVGPMISGGSISGRLIVEAVDEHTINMALKIADGKMFNENVLEEFVKADPGQKVPVMDKQHLETPIQLKIVNGRILSVLMGKDEPLWTVNFKRALAAQLQLQLDASSGVFHIKSGHESSGKYYAENTAYFAPEGCTTGECLTWYHISRIPIQQINANPQLLAMPELCDGINTPVYEIVKNRDFEKCHVLPYYNFINTPGLAGCDSTSGAGCENAKAHVDMVRILGCKVDENTFIVQRIKVMDRLVTKPLGYETEAIEGLTIQNFQLVNIKSQHSSQSSKMVVPSNGKVFKTLVYSFDEEHAASGPKMSQPDMRSDNLPLVMTVDQQTALKESERLLMEIVHQLESNEFYADPTGKFVADKMNMFHKALSNLDRDQISSFVNKFATPNNPSSTVNQLVVDALVQAGTNPALMIVRDWIMSGRLQGEQAVSAIAALPAAVKTPTKELLTNLINLMKSDVVMSHQQLKFATALSVTRIVYQACINSTQSLNMFPKLVMGEFCSVHDPLITRQLVPWLSEQLKRADDDIERIAMLAALGNIGHEIILPSVMPHISSCEPGTPRETEWYERHRRSKSNNKKEDQMDDSSDLDEPLMKKEWRQKWLAYKKKHSKDEASLDELVDRFEAELKSDKRGGKGRGKDHRGNKDHHGKGPKKMDKDDLKMHKKEDKEEIKLHKQMEDESILSGVPKSQQHRKQTVTNHKDHADELKSAKKEDKEDLKWHAKEAKEESKIKVHWKNMEKELQEPVEFSDDDYEVVMTEEEEDLERYLSREGDDEDDEVYATELAEDQASCNILRLKAIYSLSSMAVAGNPVVAKILMPIYFNKAEETEIRLAALSLLFISVPPTAFWERVAVSTWTESNDQVAHYVYTTISSLVQNKDPKRRQVTERAESVLPMLKPMRWTSFVSSNYLKAGYQEKTRLGYLTKTVNFPGFESFFPSNHYNSLYVRAGPWFSRLFDVAINSKQPEKFIDRLFGKPAARYSASKEDSGMHPELERIQRDLKIEARATGQPEIFLYVNVMDNYQRFLAITPATLENLVEKLMSQSSGQRSLRGQPGINMHTFMPLVDVFVRVPSAMGLAYSTISQVRLLASVKANMTTSVDFRSFKSLSADVSGTILPVLNLEMASKVTIEVPWSRSYPTAGVHIETTLAAPGRMSLSTDLKTGKIQTSWEFLGDKLRLARWAVLPFTTIRRVGDYTPSLLLKETKPVILLDRPNSEDLTFGQRSLGLHLLYTARGDVQAMNTPLSYKKDLMGSLLFSIFPSTMRFQERNLYLDNSQSETKTIKTTLSFAAKDKFNPDEELEMTDDWEDQMLSRGIFGSRKATYDQYLKKMKAGEDLSSRADQQWHQRKLRSVLHSMAEPTGFSMDATVELTGRSSSVQARRYGTSMSYGVGDYGLSHRGKLMMEKRLWDDEQPSQRSGEDNFVLCVDLDAKMPRPEVVRREEFARDDLSRTSTVKIAFGKSCTNDRKITITTRMARSEEEIPSTVQSKWQDRECSKQEMFGRGVSEQCLSTRRLASTLNKGVVVIDYNEMPPMVRNLTVKASGLFSRWMGAHMSDNQVDVTNTANQIRIETVYYPIIGSMDLRVYKPKSNTFYHGIEVHPIAEAVLPFNPRLTAFRAIYGGPGLCLVDRNSITTYDGLTYNASSSGCDQLVTKDCSGRYNMAVLSRQEGNAKVVTVLLNHVKIEMNAAAMRVKVNDQDLVNLGEPGSVKQVRDAEGNVLANVRKTSDGFIELDSPSHWIRVTLDANELIILNSPIHRGRLCGLCGTQTGHKETDLTGPGKCSLPEDLMPVAYELRTPAGCRSNINPSEREVLRRLQDRCAKEESSSVFGLTDRRPLMTKSQQHKLSLGIRSVSSDESDFQMEGECELMRNRMIHRGRKRCFSVEPALKCSVGCQPTAFNNIKMGFHCIVAGDPLSDELKEAMSVRPLDEVAGLDVTNFAVMRVPTGCSPAGPGESMSVMSPKKAFKMEHRMH